MSDEQKAPGQFWFGFFAGGILGAFLIFILGTKEGKKLAKKLEEKAELVEEDLEQKIGKLEKKGQELLSEAEAMKDKVTTVIEDKKQSTSDELIKKMDETFSRIENIQKKGVALTEEVHKKFFKKDGKTLSS